MLYLSGGDDNPHVRKAREAARQRQQLSLLSVQEGGLPLDVRDRLLEQARRQNTERHCFTSDLSVNELSLVHLAGYEPLGQIMGSSVCYVAQDWLPYDVRQDGFSFALESLPQAFHEARQLGLGRLQQEATLLGATGVVGVRIETTTHEWTENGIERELLEFTAIGTAIREKGKPAPIAGKQGSKPFLSNLAGAEFWALQQAHYHPVDVVCGYTAYAHMPSRATTSRLRSFNNQEIKEYTEASYKARKLAMLQLEAEANALGVEGVVGARTVIKGNRRGIEGVVQDMMIFYFSCIGTAIAPIPPDIRRHLPTQHSRGLLPVISLKDNL